MPRPMTCPARGKEDGPTGERTAEGIAVSCDRCGARWPRDTPYTCAACRGRDIRMRGQALTRFSRGTQPSIVGLRDIPLCAECDAGTPARAKRQKPVPGRYRSAAADRGGEDDGEG